MIVSSRPAMEPLAQGPMALTLSRNALACGLEGQESLANPALLLLGLEGKKSLANPALMLLGLEGKKLLANPALMLKIYKESAIGHKANGELPASIISRADRTLARCGLLAEGR